MCETIAKEIGYPLEEVRSDSCLAEELGLDFYDLAELVMALEARFSVRISDSAWSSFESVADIERFVRAHFVREQHALRGRAHRRG